MARSDFEIYFARQYRGRARLGWRGFEDVNVVGAIAQNRLRDHTLPR